VEEKKERKKKKKKKRGKNCWCVILILRLFLGAVDLYFGWRSREGEKKRKGGKKKKGEGKNGREKRAVPSLLASRLSCHARS